MKRQSANIGNRIFDLLMFVAVAIWMTNHPRITGTVQQYFVDLSKSITAYFAKVDPATIGGWFKLQVVGGLTGIIGDKLFSAATVSIVVGILVITLWNIFVVIWKSSVRREIRYLVYSLILLMLAAFSEYLCLKASKLPDLIHGVSAVFLTISLCLVGWRIIRLSKKPQTTS